MLDRSDIFANDSNTGMSSEGKESLTMVMTADKERKREEPELTDHNGHMCPPHQDKVGKVLYTRIPRKARAGSTVPGP